MSQWTIKRRNAGEECCCCCRVREKRGRSCDGICASSIERSPAGDVMSGACVCHVTSVGEVDLRLKVGEEDGMGNEFAEAQLRSRFC